MRKETDLSKVKTVAKTFLMQDIKETPMSPLVVKHPFTDSALIVAQDSEGRVTQTNRWKMSMRGGIGRNKWKSK